MGRVSLASSPPEALIWSRACPLNLVSDSIRGVVILKEEAGTGNLGRDQSLAQGHQDIGSLKDIQTINKYFN